MNQELFLEDLLGYNSSVSGSNNWVISGARTKSGKPLLANDPHLKFTQPPRWYEMHLKGGRLTSVGCALQEYQCQSLDKMSILLGTNKFDG